MFLTVPLITMIAIRVIIISLIVNTWLLLPRDVRLMVLGAVVFGLYHYCVYHLPFAQHHQPLLQFQKQLQQPLLPPTVGE